MTTELRCDGTLYGVIADDGLTIEVKCKRRKCGYAPGIVILHTLSIATGQVVKTQKFKQPSLRKGI
jgi:hypothetical protein